MNLPSGGASITGGITVGTHSIAGLHHHPPAPVTDRHIHFYGEDFFDPTKHYAFSVLAGDKPPTIVGGYAQWKTLRRPLQRSLTVFDGYDPASMQVSIRFLHMDGSGWRTGDEAGLAIEKQIEILEWMAGESFLEGPSPFVWLSTYDRRGNTVPLIPFEYQAASPSVPSIFGGGDTTPWIVTGLQWDDSPDGCVRNDNGYRVRQDATVTVQYYQGTNSNQQGGDARTKTTTIVSRFGVDTPLLIARNEPTREPLALARAIMTAPQNANLRLRSVNQSIKHGKVVRIPKGA